MPFPTDGFSSMPISVRTGITDHAENDMVVTATVTIERDGNLYTLSDDQTQALFAAVGDVMKTYLTTQFPTASTIVTSVTYTASTSINIS